MSYGARELTHIAMQNLSMVAYRDLQSAKELLRDLLRSSYEATYGVTMETLRDIAAEDMVKTAIRLCFDRRHYIDGLSEGALAAFPGQEIVCVYHGAQDDKEKEKWKRVWVSAGGKLYNGRMIAHKKDPIWVKISRFHRPYPPFDFGSCMGIDDIDFYECAKMGVIRRKRRFKSSTLKTIRKSQLRETKHANGCLKPVVACVLTIGMAIVIATVSILLKNHY